MTPASSHLSAARSVQRWPTERPLFFLCVVLSIGIWIGLIVSIIGLIYAAILSLFFLFAHASFVAHVRGNGVRLSPSQFPDLYQAVRRLSDQLGMEDVPEAYLMQAGGTLNAFATRFFRSNFIVLFTDLLEACGENTAARDMIIAHELGHLKAGHLQWRWLIMPAYVIPFLGMALSRAREYTCDRYGLAGAGNVEGAVLGLTILAAGGKHAPSVNQAAFLAQRETLTTGWMAIGEWLSTHPPLAKRVAQLLPPASRDHVSAVGANLRGAGILGTMALIVTAATATGAVLWTTIYSQLASPTGAEFGQPVDLQVASAQVQSDFTRISDMLLRHLAAGGTLPESWDGIEDLWTITFPEDQVPYDPFDGARYGYEMEGDSYVLWSSGPDAIPGTDDDIMMRPSVRLLPN